MVILDLRQKLMGSILGSGNETFLLAEANIVNQYLIQQSQCTDFDLQDNNHSGKEKMSPFGKSRGPSYLKCVITEMR